LVSTISGQKEEMFTFKEADKVQESETVVHTSEGVVARQQVFKLHGFFEDTLHTFFSIGSAPGEECLEPSKIFKRR
jgi:hypothetical protein